MRKLVLLFLSITAFVVTLADQILYSHEDTAAPSVSPTDEICGITANISSCSSIVDWDALDPALYPMLLPNNKVFYAYVRPDVSTFYRENILNAEDGASQRKTLQEVKPMFNGMAGRFVNMSPDPMLLLWIPGGTQDNLFITYIASLEQSGTATYPGHRFCMAPVNDEKQCVKTFEVKEGVSRYTYDPFVEDPTNYHLEDLTFGQLERYQRLERAEDFSRRYRTFTGRDFLSNYPRHRVKHYMYPADYFGQTHTVETKETHFVKLPPKELLGAVPNERSNESAYLKDYRTELIESMNMTLTVLSCAPRVFEIKHFLSDVEVDHFMDLAGVMVLQESSVSGSSDDVKLGQNRIKSTTRTSTNTWVSRDASPIIDTVYRRAADLLHIDEILLRDRNPDDYPDIPSTRSIAEPLQLVHYLPGQEYNAHHDFVYPKTMDKFQSARFATILLYLNEGMDGGETSFPRWVNTETVEGLKVKPEKGKAVLFYSFLPDGNLDDLSQHAALPVRKGEKWLTNLWIWDPLSSV